MGPPQTFRSLLASLPVADHIDFDFIEAWIKIACTHTLTVPGESRLCARWQQPYSGRRVLQWIKRHSQYVNQMPHNVSQAGAPIGLDPQECFNKALEAVAALKPDVGNKGACLNYNLLGICSDPKCSYRHARAKSTPERIEAVVDALRPAVQSYLTSGGQTERGSPS
jgi:hypothetical protein